METMKYRIEKDRIFITLAKGDFINKSFEQLSVDEGIKGAWLNGIGAFKNPEVGYYDLGNKTYQRRRFDGDYELTSLVGNITMKEGQPFAHNHITFSDTEYRVFGGHLFDAEITAAGEFVLFRSEEEIHRKMNNEIGLALWCLDGHGS